MTDQKIYFYRDESLESREAKDILDTHHVKYEEVFSNSDRELPCIIASGSAVPFFGFEGVNLYVSYFADTKQ